MRFDLADQLQEEWVQNFTCFIARFAISTWPPLCDDENHQDIMFLVLAISAYPHL